MWFHVYCAHHFSIRKPATCVQGIVVAVSVWLELVLYQYQYLAPTPPILSGGKWRVRTRNWLAGQGITLGGSTSQTGREVRDCWAFKLLKWMKTAGSSRLSCTVPVLQVKTDTNRPGGQKIQGKKALTLLLFTPLLNIITTLLVD